MITTELQISDLPKDLQTEIKDKQYSLRLYDFKVLRCTKEASANGYITYKVYAQADCTVYLITKNCLKDETLIEEYVITIRDLKILKELVQV